MNTRTVVAGFVLTLGWLAFSASTASAQFFTPNPYGGFVTPSGGIVRQSTYYNPFNGYSTITRSYVNPYTGVTGFKQLNVPNNVPFYGGFHPGFGYGNFGNPWAFNRSGFNLNVFIR